MQTKPSDWPLSTDEKEKKYINDDTGDGSARLPVGGHVGCMRFHLSDGLRYLYKSLRNDREKVIDAVTI